mgnify:CR=1 FL=1
MNKKISLIIGVIISIGLLVLVFIFVRSLNISSSTPYSGQGTAISTFPTTGSVTNPRNTVSIRTANGKNIQTKDFLKDPDIWKDPMNSGYYSLGHHFSSGTPPPPYDIQYIEASNFFNVGLFQEPIAQSRKEAEKYMMEHLGISPTQMCELNYSVGTTNWVNGFYSGQDLRFSFCPGSVQIPE